MGNVDQVVASRRSRDSNRREESAEALVNVKREVNGGSLTNGYFRNVPQTKKRPNRKKERSRDTALCQERRCFFRASWTLDGP